MYIICIIIPGFIVLLVMYLPISTVGYGIVGSEVPGNILRAVSGYVVQVTQGEYINNWCYLLYKIIVIIL